MADPAGPDVALVHIVEDDADVRDALAVLLEIRGLDVREHASARDFLDALPGLARGCVVTDVQMPGMSGLDMLASLRDLSLDWPAVVVTGRKAAHTAEAAARLGADFLEKPFPPEALIEAITRGLAAGG